MLIHHDMRKYEDALSDAAKGARVKMQAIIDKGRASAGQLLERVHTFVPEDQIVPAAALKWIVTPEGLEIGIPDGKPTRSFHRNAIRQAAADAEIPLTYVDRLADQFASDTRKAAWAGELLAHNFREIFARRTARNLLRAVPAGTDMRKMQVRGFLSDRYRRLDVRPLLDSFCKAAGEIGAVPIEGRFSDTKVWMKVALPQIIEPVPNEPMLVFLTLENSDFGNGAFDIELGVLRLWCTNSAMMESCMRRVHLGTRLGDNIAFSQATYESDTKTMCLATDDLVRGTLGPAKIDEVMGAIRQANEEKLDPKAVPALLKRQGLTKKEAQEVQEVYTSADVVNLPPGNSMWRLSNALSFIAGKQTDADKALDFEKAAGSVLNKAA